MVKVYFETSTDGINSDGKYSELVAEFTDETLYNACLPVLEKWAKDEGMIVTESLDL